MDALLYFDRYYFILELKDETRLAKEEYDSLPDFSVKEKFRRELEHASGEDGAISEKVADRALKYGLAALSGGDLSDI